MHDTRLDREQRDMIRTVGTSGRALLALIEDILDVSKIEAGKMSVDAVDFDLHAELADILSILRPQAEAGGLRLLVEISPRCDFALHGGLQHLRQIVTNLVANAIKFTERGHVLLQVDAAEAEGERIALELRIKDTGIGIALEEQNRIFDSFTKADEDTNRRYGGTGLGLSITKQLVDILGGEIGVTSRAGNGSTFWVRLPFTRLGTADEQPVSLSAGRVVVVSGDDDAVGFVDGALAPYGLFVVPAASLEALSDLLEGEIVSEGRFHIVLIDARDRALDPLAVTAAACAIRTAVSPSSSWPNRPPRVRPRTSARPAFSPSSPCRSTKRAWCRRFTPHRPSIRPAPRRATACACMPRRAAIAASFTS